MRSTSEAPFIAVALLLMGTAVITIFYGALQGYRRYGGYAGARLVQTVVALAAGLVLIQLGWGPVGAILGYVVGILVILVYFAADRKSYAFRPGYENLRREAPAIRMIFGIFLVLSAVESVPVVLARARLETHESGLFAALWNLRNVVWPFAWSIGVTFYSHLMPVEKEEGLLWKTMPLVGVLGGAFILAGLLFPEWILGGLYGPEFVGAADWMALYGVSLLLQMAMMVCMFHEVATRRASWVAFLAPLAIFAAGLVFSGRTAVSLIEIQIAACTGYFVFWAAGKVAQRVAA